MMMMMMIMTQVMMIIMYGYQIINVRLVKTINKFKQ